MPQLLFVVEETFMITGRGLILVPGNCTIPFNAGDPIKLVRADGTIIMTKVYGFDTKCNIMTEKNVSKEDVPPGTEVWLDK